MANKILIKELSRIAEWFEHQAEVGYHGDVRDYEDAAHTITRAVELLKEQETANLYKCPNCGTWVSAENVVRCKDCKYSKASDSGDGIVCDYDSLWHEADWFCADGKRR